MVLDAEVRPPRPMLPGPERPARLRNQRRGTANAFCCVERTVGRLSFAKTPVRT